MWVRKKKRDGFPSKGGCLIVWRDQWAEPYPPPYTRSEGMGGVAQQQPSLTWGRLLAQFHISTLRLSISWFLVRPVYLSRITRLAASVATIGLIELPLKGSPIGRVAGNINLSTNSSYEKQDRNMQSFQFLRPFYERAFIS